MKAYRLSIADDDDAGMEIVWANTGKEAKKKASGEFLDNLSFIDDGWIALRVHRDKRYDDMEHLGPIEFALRQWHDGWKWLDMDIGYPDEVSDEEFVKTYKDYYGIK